MEVLELKKIPATFVLHIQIKFKTSQKLTDVRIVPSEM
jgi:hypothetical protein